MAGPLGAGEGSQAKNSSCRSTHNQTETLGRRLVPSKNCVMENQREEQSGSGKGKEINTPYYVPSTVLETLPKLTS